MDSQTVGTVLLLTTNELARKAFEQIVLGRRVRLKDLRQEILKDRMPTIETHALQQVLDDLEKNKLIAHVEEEPAIDDFRTYYLTADGFAAERKLRELGLEISTG